MKKSISFIIALVLVQFIFAADIITDSKITNVTVYLQGATINTTSTVQLPEGVSQITISKQTQFVDANSLQVSGKGDFVILGVQFQINYIEKQEQTKQIKDLQTAKKALELQQKQLNDETTVYKTEEQLLDKNMELKGQNTGLSVLELEKAANFYRTRLLELKKKQFDIAQKLEDIEIKIQDIFNQLQELQNVVNEPTGEIVVTVSSKEAQTVQLLATYFIPNAGWVPYYDIRVKDVANPVNVTYKATITQNSGVAWNNVKVTLSTGNPTLGGTAPELYKWVLYQENPVANGYKKSKAMYAAPAAANYELDEKAAASDVAIRGVGSISKEASYNFAVESQKLTTAEFAIEEPISLQSDGKSAYVTIKEHTIPAEYKYKCVPKLDNDAFLIAKITGYEAFNFLTGNANLYFEGAYVGESYLNLDNAEDTLQLSLGRDKGIAIERKRVDEFSAKKVLGGKRKELQTWEISVKNNKQMPINIDIQDHVPVSGQSDIEVTDVAYTGATIDKETSIVTWTMNIDKNTSKKVQISYQITYPKDWIVNTK
jgi:uncharacterized protein (TIGR02231 family)